MFWDKNQTSEIAFKTLHLKKSRPMRTHTQTDIATLWLNRPSGPIQWKVYILIFLKLSLLWTGWWASPRPRPAVEADDYGIQPSQLSQLPGQGGSGGTVPVWPVLQRGGGGGGCALRWVQLHLQYQRVWPHLICRICLYINMFVCSNVVGDLSHIYAAFKYIHMLL